ncbi:hypothetical protein [Sporomusa sphaeroides]|uniref:hypothetical protein n=1 Tax=Sporomusa sphaeroides TaxID=47679 RepID=UPI00315912D4
MIRIQLPEDLIEELVSYITEMEEIDGDLLPGGGRKSMQSWTLDLAAQAIVSAYLHERKARKMAAISKVVKGDEYLWKA